MKMISLPAFITRDYLSHHTDEVRSILYMISGAFWFSVMTAMVRYLSHQMNVFEIVFFRNFFALAFMISWLVRSEAGSISTTRFKLYGLRSMNGMIAMMLWFSALTLVPLPQAVALSFSTPLFTTLAAMIFLHEKVGRHRWMALMIGFAGTLIILRPGGHFEMSYLLVLGASVSWSISNILIKQLTRTESPHAIVFYMTLFMTPISLPPALLHWTTPSMKLLLWLVVLAAIANLAQICISKAYSKADMSVVQPFDFTRLIFASVIAYLMFDEVIDLWTMVGAIIILASTIYITHREALAKRKYGGS